MIKKELIEQEKLKRAKDKEERLLKKRLEEEKIAKQLNKEKSCKLIKKLQLKRRRFKKFQVNQNDRHPSKFVNKKNVI